MVTFNSRISNKKDTSENWEANNPILLNGELIIVIEDSGLFKNADAKFADYIKSMPETVCFVFVESEVRFKVGNGTSHYLELPFVETGVSWGTF